MRLLSESHQASIHEADGRLEAIGRRPAIKAVSSHSPCHHAIVPSFPSAPKPFLPIVCSMWFVLDADGDHALGYIITHVFCPLQLPGESDYTVFNDYNLAGAICAAAHACTKHISSADLPQWNPITKMLDNLRESVQYKDLEKNEVVLQLERMRVGDTLAFLIRAQNAAVIFRKQEHATLCESMEVSPAAEAVMGARGKLLCSYPGPAIEVPNHIFDDETFQSELANFLCHMHEDILDSAATGQKAQATVIEERDTTHPRYITELLTGIFRGVGRPADPVRITKRLGDDVVWDNSRLPWRRSSIWLLIRVALQTSLGRTSLDHHTYKTLLISFMCNLAEQAARADFSNDVLHFMSTKISRRLGKLGPSAPNWLSTMALQSCNGLRSVLDERWMMVQNAQRISPLWAPSKLDLIRDSQPSLPNCRAYVQNTLTTHNIPTTGTHFKPDHHPRGTLKELLSTDAAFFEKAYRADSHVALYDVELAVEKGLDAWIGGVRDMDKACEMLEILATKYSSYAKKRYAKNPEHTSIMLLTTLELWIALDKLAVKATPMLADYSPEVPITLLRHLLLRKASDLARLRSAFLYISSRHSRSRPGWSAFSKEVSPDTFAVRYYNGSKSHKAIKSQIEAAANNQVKQKLAELNAANAEYVELVEQVKDTEHTFGFNWEREEYYHARRRCLKCQLERRLHAMKIAVHEWPLPAEPLQAALVVFELRCPVSFDMWRSLTFHLLLDICSPAPEREEPYILLDQYQALSSYLIKHPRPRISLASQTKPFIKTHYSHVPIPTTEDRICVPNGLTFYGYDTGAHIRTSDALGSIKVKGYCTYALPDGPYHNLQRYMDATTHTSNKVLANQADCHQDLSIHEFIAFGHLRSGGSLQWLNILRELRDRTLSFRRHEVHHLFSQAASQVGPFTDTGELVWHQELQWPSFCPALLSELENMVTDVEANWLEGVTMGTISFILLRVLASSPNDGITGEVLRLLGIVRKKTYVWVQELSQKVLDASADDEHRSLLRDTAAICRSTFDVGLPTARVLFSSPQEIEVFLSCAIFVHDNIPAKLPSIPVYSQLLLARDRRLSLTLESVLRDIIHADTSDEGIDLAILKVWPSYRPGSKWKAFSSPNSRWLSCKTAEGDHQCAQTVNFNLLDGTLLVDGKPLSQLPAEVVEHRVYQLLFGERVFDVMPSNLPGMTYLVRGMISDHQIHITLKGKDLIVRAKHKEATGVIELIPRGKLREDLPAVLVDGHVHWLDISTSVIEIRPLEKLWERCLENWEIHCSRGKYSIRRGNDHLVDVRSATWTMVSNRLKPLEAPENLMVIVSPPPSPTKPLQRQLSVYLPRYDLSFFVDEDGDLQSRNLRGMVYDQNQSVGTFFGLVNQLVLRPKHQLEPDLLPRCVLIPDGDVSFEKHGHHVRVEIDLPHSPRQRLRYHTYRIDSELGCLTGNVSLTNKLYRAYLHALTSSGYSTDPLTGRTGTEEALCLLRSASCLSITKVVDRDADLLRMIASLCPARNWYPQHLRTMQQVDWLDLPVSNQRHELYIAAQTIKVHCEQIQLFYENRDPRIFAKFPLHDDHLFERSAIRAAYLLPPEGFDRPAGANHDVAYQARDIVDAASAAEHHAYTAARTVYQPSSNSKTPKNILTVVESWPTDVLGKAFLSFHYERSWLVPDLPSIWIEAYDMLRRGDRSSYQFQLLFSLSAMAYHSPELRFVVPIFVAFDTCPQFSREDPPPYPSYDLSAGYRPSAELLRLYIEDSAYHLEDCLEMSEVDATVDKLLSAWPSESPSQISLDYLSYDVIGLTSKVQRDFATCYRNLMLKEHLIRVQEILISVCSHSPPAPSSQYSFTPRFHTYARSPWARTPQLLFTRPAPSLPTRDRLPNFAGRMIERTASVGFTPLQELIATVQRSAKDPFQSKYASNLRNSARYFGNEPSIIIPTAVEHPTIDTFRVHYVQCKDRFVEALYRLKVELGPTSKYEHVLSQSGGWPRITADSLLRCLASCSPIKLSDDWKKCLIKLAQLALAVQRARRLLQLRLDNLHEEFYRELENKGCDGWDAKQYPDWLLIQLQGNFLVRRVQAKVAFQMISPRSGDNTAMQLNMGEGKSSVIVPIVVTALADGNQLVRIIVPKALTAQMFQLLVDRLGGLVNRPVYYLPFSRSLELDPRQLVVLRQLMSNKGVLVAQPEHILSLKLMSVEKQLTLSNSVNDSAARLLGIQRWLHSHARDILDESDEILHVRYQLVYTIGDQQPMEGFPERWTTTQQVLSLVKKYATVLRDRFPSGVEYECLQDGSFPHFRILQDDAGEALVSCIVQDVMAGHLPNFSFEQLPSTLRVAISSFVSSKDIPLSTVKMVEAYSRTSVLWNGLLLLRGLLVTGILLFAFRERRWRVDYGLSLKRTMLAVPYRAKDVPAQRAEFGHPDVAIILTCLSYYYSGLNEEQLRLCFELLLKQDDPSSDYELWIQRCRSVPDSLRSLSGVNIKSSEQWNTHLFRFFSRNQSAIDFYLTRVVFPKAAKEFPSKLSSSGWDLAERRARLTTGFSGTNDGRYLLPMPITQHDPPHQQGTNARVLTYLLQPENNFYLRTSYEDGERRSTHQFLEMVTEQKPEIRVVLDVGAQMLDLQNHELAKAWLGLTHQHSAAVYFNEDDELTVLTRDGSTQLLLSSPFAQQLDQCIIYLDDAHTRGTDMRLPNGFRAAVTLGPKVTKDRLAQGCMRMRKLGHGHSIMFFAPLEVDRSIRSVAGKGPEDVINVSDILHWTIHETCTDIQQRAPHWAQQGMDHSSRYHAWSEFCKRNLTSRALSEQWLQPEAKTLAELYAPHEPSDVTSLKLSQIRERCMSLGISCLRDVGMDEEQEREVFHEVERERQVERPPKASPVPHSVDQEVVSFVKTGIIPPKSKAFIPLIRSLETTSAATNEPHVWSSSLWATKDFCTTVGSSTSGSDEYLRPVQWVVSCGEADRILVIFSPSEVNNLMSDIRTSKHIHLHVYIPHTMKSMKPCDDLKLYTIPALPADWTPPWNLIDQLNAFAGQLYFKDYASYFRLCRFLCVYAGDVKEEEGVNVESDGFIAPKNRPLHMIDTRKTFTTSPLPSLRVLISLRRKGMRFASTHIGKLLDGRLLSERDFDGSNADNEDF